MKRIQYSVEFDNPTNPINKQLFDKFDPKVILAVERAQICFDELRFLGIISVSDIKKMQNKLRGKLGQLYIKMKNN